MMFKLMLAEVDGDSEVYDDYNYDDVDECFFFLLFIYIQKKNYVVSICMCVCVYIYVCKCEMVAVFVKWIYN